MTAGAAVDAPEDAVDGFLGAVARRDVGAASDSLCRDVCFVTQDATAIRGRDSVATLLGQLIATGLEVRPRDRHSISLGEYSLVAARWHVRLPAEPRALTQETGAMLALARRESRWKLLLIAPWGWP